MTSRTETGATGAKWSLRAASSRALAVEEPNEHAVCLSRDLRRELAERLARLSYREEPGARAVDRARGGAARPARADEVASSFWPPGYPGVHRRTGIRRD
jgi:hypothetical protein